MLTETEIESGAVILKLYADFFKTQQQSLNKIIPYKFSQMNRTFVPIGVTEAHGFNDSAYKVISSDNIFFTKVLNAFSALFVEVDRLKEETFNVHLPFVITFGLYEGEIENKICEEIDNICTLTAFVERLQNTTKNICNQLFSLFETTSFNIDDIEFHYIIKEIAEVFTLLILVEYVILDSELFKQWHIFKKYVHDLKEATTENLKTLCISQKKIKLLLSTIENINTRLFSDKIVESCMKSISYFYENLIPKNQKAISTEFNNYMRQALYNLDKLFIGNSDINFFMKCVKMNSLFVFISNVFANVNRKSFILLTDINEKAHSILVYKNVVWYPEILIQRHIPSLSRELNKMSDIVNKAREIDLFNKKANFSKDINYYITSALHWSVNIEILLNEKNNQLNSAQINSRMLILFDGLNLLHQVSNTVQLFIYHHLSQNIPFTKTLCKSIFVTFETIKNLENVIKRNEANIKSILNVIDQHLIYQALNMLGNMKRNITNNKNIASSAVDDITCILIAEKVLSETSNEQTLTTAYLATSLINRNSRSDDVYEKFVLWMDKIKRVREFTKIFRSLCDMSWLLWHNDIMFLYLKHNNINKIYYFNVEMIFSIFDDCLSYLWIYNKRSYKYLKKTFDKMIIEDFKNPTNQIVETYIRLKTHSHLEGTFESDIIINTTIANDLFYIYCHLKCFPYYVSAKSNLEQYLSKTYYNLTTIYLSNWKTYEEMRKLAKFRFHLESIEDDLPTQTLEQGVDVLEIMKNFDTFVSNYVYNLNNQIFIERCSNNKHLNSINIQHIANSIRSHGTGILNTTVNLIYKYLKSKFSDVSTFMYNENIKSRLIHEMRNYSEDNDMKLYNYKTAEKFCKNIKNLGFFQDANSALDYIREVITKIGNAMGYVRMIRSGGRHYYAESTVFLPIDVINFNESMKNTSSSKTIESSKCLDKCMENFKMNFTQGTEYFKLLVDVFITAFKGDINDHLKYFYLIVPPLMLNFIESIVLAKDNLNKKNKCNGAFTDDGFAMGLAYILTLLDQNEDLNALHWFDAVCLHINSERKNISEQKNKLPMLQAIALSEKKLNILEQEFKLLFYSFSSARIFFQ